jgi:hypothetical protein
MNLIVIFTTPHLSFIDVNARAVMHFEIIMQRKYPQMGLSEAKLNFSSIKNNPHDPSDKMYHFAPRIFTDDGVLKIDTVFFQKPSKKMQKAIDLKVNSFKREVLEAAIEKADRQAILAQKEAEKKTPAEQARAWAEDIFEQKTRYLDPITNKWDTGAIMLDYPEMSPSRLATVKKLLKALEKRSLEG